MSTQADKIYAAIERVRTHPNLSKMDASGMDVTFDEHYQYQNIQAEMHAGGILPTDAAQIIYTALGEIGSAKNGGWAAGTDLATKVVVTQVIGELLKARIGAPE